ncbi:hypothetical protein AQ490_26185 [Wenjunlia vitaminophila]|uniref:DUF2834 domain-containing protein n=2 Tax=Wenjunlia vitaminophila TaxID=76728 RepID=A0A0T6LQD6_WENVI|nr:hypothetical protein AQ490_26185 [Wenjunlia vitaminophila]
MRGNDRAMCVCYGLLAVAGFVFMSSLAIAYVLENSDRGLGIVTGFVEEALSNLAGKFIYADLTLVWAMLAVFMVVEGRRLGIRHVWAYIVGAPLLALAVSFPLFMLVRQFKIAATATSTEPAHMRTCGMARGTQR